MARFKRRMKRTGREPREKLSERISTFAGSYIRLGDTPEKRQDFLNGAVSAWNIACMPEAEREAAMDQYMDIFRENNPHHSEEDVASVRGDIEKLIQQKLRLFPDDERRIVAADLIPTGEGHDRIEVVSMRDE